MKNVLIYTVHKAASSFLNKLTLSLSKELHLNYLSISDDKYFEHIKNNSWVQFMEEQNHTGVFGPIRSGAADPCIPNNLNDSSIILHLRDPRDVITSLFFWAAYKSNSKKKILLLDGKEKKIEKEDIDQFVLQEKGKILQRYKTLCDNLLQQPNVTFLKYETLVTDYHLWLTGFLSAFDHVPKKRFLGLFPIPGDRKRLRQKLYNQFHHEFKVASEDASKHRRQITPGDYLRKLKPETIAILNQEFKEILDLLDYK